MQGRRTPSCYEADFRLIYIMGKIVFSLLRKATNTLSGRRLREISVVEFLWRLIYTTFGPKGITLITCQGSKMYVNANLGYGGLGPILLIHGVYEGYETELFKRLVKPGMVVVDIGANIGYYSLIAAKSVGRYGSVYAFEPEPNNYDLLLKSIEINGYDNVIPVHKAVSNKQGRVKLFVDKVSPVHPSLSEVNIDYKAGFVEVEAITLDSFFDDFVKDSRVDLIKMDTQGAEGLVIEGADKILTSNNLKILMEFWPYGLSNLGTDPLNLLNTLRNYGFKLKLLDGTDIDVAKIINMCNGTSDGRGYVNLFLEK
jgi:FkbM family methyltransferase